MTNKSILEIEVHKLTSDFVDKFAPLMDEYRVFYGKQSNIAESTHYVRRLLEDDSVVFLMAVLNSKEIIGFCTLFRSYSSVRAA